MISSVRPQVKSRLNHAETARASIAALLLVFPMTVTGAGTGHGFAWANEPSSPVYTPQRQYSFNSAGREIKIKRTRQGTYGVTFAGLGGNGSPGGHVQVSAYGPGSEHCKAVSWDSARADFVVNVRCFNARGASIDTRFSIHVLWPTQSRMVRPQAPSPQINREILENGSVKTTYADGSYRIAGSGGVSITSADGQTSRMAFSTQAPAAIPPAPPGNSTESVWLQEQSDGLLNIISTLVGGDQQSIDYYLAAEGSVGVYEQLVKRRTTLARLIR